jgi:hypothetical protein
VYIKPEKKRFLNVRHVYIALLSHRNSVYIIIVNIKGRNNVAVTRTIPCNQYRVQERWMLLYSPRIDEVK